MPRLNFGMKFTAAVCLLLVGLAVLANQPLLTPERAPAAAASTTPLPEPLVGTWAHESGAAYILFEYRDDHTFKSLVQTKTLYGRLFVGNRTLSGTWERPDNSHVKLSFENKGGGPARGPAASEIRFDGADTFTVVGKGETWRRVEKRL